ncbi:MAG: sulfite exporter TauE/SafE family protein [Ruminococcus sp.]|nr:sulfite exporter TauE/SafE family protein [Ruminococcus sp.]
MKKKKGKIYFAIAGVIIGVINGLFGSGGGVAAVPALQKADIAVKKAHASSLAVTLPLSIVSAVVYASMEDFKWGDALILIPFGLAGALIGGLILKKMKNVWLKRIFGGLLIISGVKMLFF